MGGLTITMTAEELEAVQRLVGGAYLRIMEDLNMGGLSDPGAYILSRQHDLLGRLKRRLESGTEDE